MKYVVRNRGTKTLIGVFGTKKEANDAIAEYEFEDMANGIYKPNFYECAVMED